MAKNEEYNEEVQETSKVTGLDFFMPDKALESKPEEFVVSKRFRDNEGKVIPFKMKAITVDQMEAIEKDCTERKRVRGRAMHKELNQKLFYETIALNSTVYPDFTDKKLLKAYGEHSSLSLAKTILSVPGEYTNWIEKALFINELDEDYEDVEEQVKN